MPECVGHRLLAHAEARGQRRSAPLCRAARMQDKKLVELVWPERGAGCLLGCGRRRRLRLGAAPLPARASPLEVGDAQAREGPLDGAPASLLVGRALPRRVRPHGPRACGRCLRRRRLGRVRHRHASASHLLYHAGELVPAAVAVLSAPVAVLGRVSRRGRLGRTFTCATRRRGRRGLRGLPLPRRVWRRLLLRLTHEDADLRRAQNVALVQRVAGPKHGRHRPRRGTVGERRGEHRLVQRRVEPGARGRVMPLYAVPLQRRLHALAREYRPLEQRGRHLAALERAAERLQVVTHRHERAGERLRAEPPHALELRGVPLLRLGRGDSQGGHRRRVAALQQRERSGAERGRRHGRCGATLHQPPFLRLEILFVCQEAPHSALHVLRAAALLLDARRGAAAYRGSACCRVRVGRRRRG
mmetsp:Transcript_47375/g.148119  ORF Transcript_47375/g.148119 Transcript_47375/m.148119 type:complete len:416 (+) Transcript_47375:281-1528(+)